MVRSFSASFLPEEITEQIIGRVSCTKSIVRCTSVCKSWYVLIKSRQFINFHLSLISNYNKNLLLSPPPLLKYDCFEVYQRGPWLHGYIYEDDFESFEVLCDYYVTIDHDIEELIRSGGSAYGKIMKFPDKLLHVHVCRGLLCYNTFDNPAQLYLWNPTIRKVKTLPMPIPNLNNYYVDVVVDRSVFKLWFDSKANDYKILRISYTTETCAVECYSLATNSWKLITDNAPLTTSYLNTYRLVYVNGIFYWPVLRNNDWVLVCLDTDNGMIFREILTEWHLESNIFLRPSGDDCSLVIIRHISSILLSDVDSWTQFYTIDTEGIIHRIPRHKTSDEFLAQSMKNGNLSLCLDLGF